ncbi:DNA-binding response regulator, partial [Yersinia pestis]
MDVKLGSGHVKLSKVMEYRQLITYFAS